MKFFSATTLLLATTASALPGIPFLDRRDAASTNASFTTVQTDYHNLFEDVTSFQPTGTGTLQEYVAIRNDAQTLQNSLNSLVSTMNSGGQFGYQDSLNLLLARVAFEPPLIAYLLLMAASKPEFDAIFGVLSVRPEILQILEVQRDLTYQVDQNFARLLAFPFGYFINALALAESTLFNFTIAIYEQPAPKTSIELPAGTLPDPSMVPTAPST